MGDYDLRGCSDESRGLGVPWILAARRRLIEPVGQCPGRTLVRGFPVALRVTKPFGHSCYPSFEALIILVFVMLIGRSRDLLHKSLLHTRQTLRRRHEGRRIRFGVRGWSKVMLTDPLACLNRLIPVGV